MDLWYQRECSSAAHVKDSLNSCKYAQSRYGQFELSKCSHACTSDLYLEIVTAMLSAQHYQLSKKEISSLLTSLMRAKLKQRYSAIGRYTLTLFSFRLGRVSSSSTPLLNYQNFLHFLGINSGKLHASTVANKSCSALWSQTMRHNSVLLGAIILLLAHIGRCVSTQRTWRSECCFWLLDGS